MSDQTKPKIQIHDHDRPQIDWAFWIVFAFILAGLFWACLDGCRA